MAKSTIPEGCVRVSFNVPKDLLEQLKDRAKAENWNQTQAFIESIKYLVNDR